MSITSEAYSTLYPNNTLIVSKYRLLSLVACGTYITFASWLKQLHAIFVKQLDSHEIVGIILEPYKNAFDWRISRLETYFLFTAFFFLATAAILHYEFVTPAAIMTDNCNEVVVVFSVFFGRELNVLNRCDWSTRVRESFLQAHSSLLYIFNCNLKSCDNLIY